MKTRVVFSQKVTLPYDPTRLPESFPFSHIKSGSFSPLTFTFRDAGKGKCSLSENFPRKAGSLLIPAEATSSSIDHCVGANL